MLRQRELLRLQRELRAERVLSVYIDGELYDPGQREAWRTRVDNRLAELRASVHAASHAEREELDRAIAALKERLDRESEMIGAPGLVAFVTADGVRHADLLPMAVADRIDWREGAFIAPYIHALVRLRPAIVAIVTTRKARLYRYADAKVHKLDIIRAHPHVGPVYHMGNPPRQGFGTNVRGSTGAEQADRAQRTAFRRMLSELTRRVIELVHDDAWIVIGGTPQAARALASALPARMGARMLVISALPEWSKDAEIAEAAAQAASRLRRARESEVVEDVIERTAEAATGVTGIEPTVRALDEHAVRELLFTRRFFDQHPLEAERAIELAFEQGAEVEEVSGVAADRLDNAANGIAARLRFVPWT